MRLLITTDTIGGVWTFTQELVPALLRRGCAVMLVSFGTEMSSAQSDWAQPLLREHASNFECIDTALPLEWMHNNERAYADAEAALLQLAAAFEADLIHCNQFCFGALPCPQPRVTTAHSDVLSWAAACRKSALEHTPWLATYRQLVQNGLSGAAAVTAPTHWMLSALAANFALPPPTQVIANGSSAALAPIHNQRQLQAVSAGRLWDEGKNLRLLSAVQSPMPILLAGDAEHETELLPGDLGPATLLGPLAHDDLLHLFRESAAYLCTSVYEPFGLAPLEAARCGCAVLAHDIPSLREVWGDEGALYFRNARDLSALLQRLSLNSELLHHAQQHSQQRAAIYSTDRMADAYLKLFERTLSTIGAAADAA